MRYEPLGISDEKAAAIASLSAYMADMVEDRRAHPRDDMVSDLLAAEVQREDGSARRLTVPEVMAFFTLLQLAGSETTARLLGWAAVLLARHPEQRAKLVAEPALAPNAVEELLRYEAPSPIQARFVTREAEWHGQTVPAVLEDRAAHRQRGPRRARVPRRRSVRRRAAVRPPRDVRVRHPLLSRGQPGSPRGSRRPRRDARPVPRMGCRRGCGRDGANVNRAWAGARPDHDLDQRPGGSIHGHTRRTRRRRHRRRIGDRARARTRVRRRGDEGRHRRRRSRRRSTPRVPSSARPVRSSASTPTSPIPRRSTASPTPRSIGSARATCCATTPVSARLLRRCGRPP